MDPGRPAQAAQALDTTRPIPYLHQTSSVFKEVAMRTTFSHMINIAGIIYYTCSLFLTFNIPVIKMHSTNVFNELCVKTTLLRTIPNKLSLGYLMRCTSGYASI